MNTRIVSGGGRPKRGYRTADGKRIPGVTTICGRFKDSGALINWAYKCGLDGIDINRARDTAGGAGTLAHELIDAKIHDRAPVLPSASALGMDDAEYTEAIERARTAFAAYEDWRETTHLEIVRTEFPLVSERYKFGGTPDALGRIKGRLVLLDWKSSGGVYADYLCQLGGYDLLCTEHNLGPIEGAHLIRFGKEFADFHHHSWGRAVLNTASEAFLLMRSLYELDAALKKAAA